MRGACHRFEGGLELHGFELVEFGPVQENAGSPVVVDVAIRQDHISVAAGAAPVAAKEARRFMIRISVSWKAD